MNPRISYILIGAFVLTGSALAVAVALWLARGEAGAQAVPYEFVFEESVTGLSDGAAVRFLGVQVGAVDAIELIGTEPPRVRVSARLRDKLPVTAHTVARLAFEGITGVAYVQLVISGSADAAATATGADGVRRIPTERSAIAALLERAPTVLDRSVAALDRVQSLLSEDNVAAAGATLGAARELMSDLATHGEEFGGVVTDARNAIGALRALTGSLNETALDIGPLLVATVDELQRTADNAERITAELERLTTGNSDALQRFVADGLGDLPVLIEALRGATVEVARLARELNRDPSALLHRNQEHTIELEP
ncbi:MAG: MlaD family protein [Pseudomonadota bacterium]